VQMFRDAGVEASHIDGKTKAADRDGLFSLLKDQDVDVLSSVGVLSEGFDLPQVEVVLLLRPTNSRGLYIQQIGRGLRPARKKVRCIVMDEVGNTYRHGPIDGPLGFDWESLAPTKTKKQIRDMIHRCATKRCPSLIHTSERRCMECREYRKKQAQQVDELGDILTTTLKLG